MIRMSLQKHDFLTGGPVKQYEIPFLPNNVFIPPTLGGYYSCAIGFDAAINTITEPTITLQDGSDTIFNVTRETVTWNGRTLVTEDSIREIVREILNEYRY